MRTSRLALIAATTGALLHLRWCLQLLPERIATHFGPGGAADGFSSRSGFLWTGLLLIFSFGLMAVLLGLLLRVMPVSLVNVPHREYWLTGERRQRSLERLRTAMEWFGVIDVLFAVGVNHSIAQSNAASETAEAARLGSDFYLLLGGFLFATIVWVVWLLRSFPKPPEGEPGQPETAEPLQPI